MISKRILGAVAVAALALMALASSASATTLEVKGVKQTGAVTIQGSLKSGTSLLLTDTFGAFVNTCTVSSSKGTTSTFTGTTVSGPVSSLSFSSCTSEPVVVDAAGTLSVENISGTTNGTVRSNGVKVTVPSGFGTITCTTSNTDMGTLTGSASGNASMAINAVLNCGAFLPSARLQGTGVVTSPLGLGIVS